MARPNAELLALQERVNKHLPRLMAETADRPVKVLVQRGQKEGTALVRLWYEDRGSIAADYEPGRQLILSEPVSVLAKLPDLAFADWLAKAVMRLPRAED